MFISFYNHNHVRFNVLSSRELGIDHLQRSRVNPLGYYGNIITEECLAEYLSIHSEAGQWDELRMREIVNHIKEWKVVKLILCMAFHIEGLAKTHRLSKPSPILPFLS